jgi:hypothetical protein
MRLQSYVLGTLAGSGSNQLQVILRVLTLPGEDFTWLDVPGSVGDVYRVEEQNSGSSGIFLLPYCDSVWFDVNDLLVAGTCEPQPWAVAVTDAAMDIREMLNMLCWRHMRG